VDTALTIYEAGTVNRILVTGDNSTLQYNEVVPVRQYLLERGVPADHIFLDYAGFNTYDSMYRARDVFEVDSAIIVTQAFHMPRAVYIAQALGISVQGYPSRITDVYFSNHIREILARVKSVMEVLLQRQPRFLGQTYPIEGDGTETLE
jgi:SanA protein